MRKPLSLPALIMLTAISMAIVVPAAHAGANPDPARAKTEQSILDGFRHCVFTVNAYSRIDTTGQAVSTSGKPKWNRNVGTALPIDADGHLLTIACVLKNAERVTVLSDTGESIKAEVVGSDTSGRIAVLKIDPDFIHEVPAGGSVGKVEKGSFAYFLGVVPDMEMAVSRGWISTIRPEDGILELLGPDTAGTSGTPILDENSNVLGILASKIDTDDIDPGLTKYAVIPYEYAYVLARYIINVAGNNVGWLGIAIDLTSPENGVLVDQVVVSSPAAAAGFLPGDRITSFRGAPVKSTSHFIDMLSGTAPAETVTFTVLRGGSSRTVTVKMGVLPGRAKNE